MENRTTNMQSHMKSYTVTCDNGATIHFTGRMFSEASYMDEETNALTRLRLFATQDGYQIYSVVTVVGTEKTHRFYKIKPQGDLCEMNDGKNTLFVPTEMLFSSVFGLCGIDPAIADEMYSSLDEELNAANAG